MEWFSVKATWKLSLKRSTREPLLKINVSVNFVSNILPKRAVRESLGDVVFHNRGQRSGSWFDGGAVERTLTAVSVSEYTTIKCILQGDRKSCSHT